MTLKWCTDLVAELHEVGAKVYGYRPRDVDHSPHGPFLHHILTLPPSAKHSSMFSEKVASRVHTR